MKIIEADQVNRVLDFPSLIASLDAGFKQDFGMPQRQVFSLSEDPNVRDGFAVLPAWNEEVVGVKAFTYFPTNEKQGLPSLYSKILLFNRANGIPLAMIDGTTVTFWRTAAVSALASRYLARTDAHTMLLLGTGNLAIPLIDAHLVEHAIERIFLWGRDHKKTRALKEILQQRHRQVNFIEVDDLPECVALADIIVSATASPTPLVLGDNVMPGCHVDLLGNHSPDRRECDTELIRKASIYVDYRANVLKEAGELLIPIAERKFDVNNIRGDLAQLCRLGVSARTSSSQITVFKSVGTALSDLICAHLVFKSS